MARDYFESVLVLLVRIFSRRDPCYALDREKRE